MKKSCFLSILAIFFGLHQVVAQGIQPVERSVGKMRLSIDPRMELLAAVNPVSDSKYLLNRESPYTQALASYFAPFSGHKAAMPTTGRLEQAGFSLTSPVAFMLYLSQPPELKREAGYSASLSDKVNGSRNLDKYRKYLKRFASGMSLSRTAFLIWTAACFFL